MKTFEFAFNLAVGQEINAMNDNLSGVNFSHLIRDLMPWIVIFIHDGDAELFLKIFDVIFSYNALGLTCITVESFDNKADEDGLFHMIEGFGE